MQVSMQSISCLEHVNSRAVEENTVLYKKTLEPIGRIMEVFGQVEHPFYIVRWPENMEDPHLQEKEEVYMNNTTIQYILPAQLNHIGTDASNVYDEEPNEKEIVSIECTEDLRGGEVVDGSEVVDYQRDYVIPSFPNSQSRQNPMQTVMPNPMQTVMPNPMQYPMQTAAFNPFMPAVAPQPTQPTQPANEYTGLDILRDSYFYIVCNKHLDCNRSSIVYQSSSSSPNRPPPLISMSSSSSSSSSFASSFFSSAAGAAAPAAGAAAPPVGMDTSLSSPEAISSSTFFPSRSARSFSIFSSSLSAPTASRTDLMFSA